MRHFLSYDSSGKLLGIHTYADGPSQLGGWPADYDLENPDTTNENVLAWKSGLKNQNVDGFVLYDCPCSPTVKTCTCPSQRFSDSYLESGVLTPRPTSGLLIDGGPQTSGSTLDSPPGTVLKLKVTCATAPDGSKVSVTQLPVVQLLDTSDLTTEVTLTSGETPEINVTSPAQGLCGELRITGDHVQPMSLKVRGWA